MKLLIKLDLRPNHMLVQLIIVPMFQTCAQYYSLKLWKLARFNGMYKHAPFGCEIAIYGSLSDALHNNLFLNRCIHRAWPYNVYRHMN